MFVDTINKFLFVTNDYGRTVKGKELQFTPSEVSNHPTNSMVFLIMDKVDKMQKVNKYLKPLGYYVNYLYF